MPLPPRGILDSVRVRKGALCLCFPSTLTVLCMGERPRQCRALGPKRKARELPTLDAHLSTRTAAPRTQSSQERRDEFRLYVGIPLTGTKDGRERRRHE